MKWTLLPTKDEDMGRSDPVSLFLAVMVLFLNFLDASYTMTLLSHPVWGNIPEEILELNPLWNGVINNLGFQTFMITKTFLVLVLVGVVLLAKKMFSRMSLSFVTGYYVNIVIIQAAHIWMFTQKVH
jgi:hypothetical protein